MIYLGADHAGFTLKEQIKYFLVSLGVKVEDLGAFEFNEQDDYPDFIRPVSQAVAQDPEHSRGIILGKSGQGEAIAANKIKGIRSTVYYGGPLDIVKLSRAHNNANVLALGAEFLTLSQAKEAARIFLDTPFEGGRHERRILKIEN